MSEEEQERRKTIVNDGQFAISASCDFGEQTWTFQMLSPDFIVSAGEFIIVPRDRFEQLLKESGHESRKNNNTPEVGKE